MLLMVIIVSSLAVLARASTSKYAEVGSNHYSYGNANGHVHEHSNLRSNSFQNVDGSFGYSYQYGNPHSSVQVSFTSEPSHESGFRQSAIKSGRPIYHHNRDQQQQYQYQHQAAQSRGPEDQYASPSASNYRYLQTGRTVTPPIYDGGATQHRQTQTSSSAYRPRAAAAVHDVDSQSQYSIGGHEYSVGTFKVPAFPRDETKIGKVTYDNPTRNEPLFRDLYQYHPDTFRYAHPENVVPLNVFGLPPQHRFQHPVGNVESAVPVVVHTNAYLPGPVVDSGVKKGSGHYEDSQKFIRLYNQHPDTYRYVNPERNTPLNVFGLPPQHQYQSPYGNVNSFRPQEVFTNAQLPGPVVDVRLNRPSLSSSFTRRVPTTGDARASPGRSQGVAYQKPSGHYIAGGSSGYDKNGQNKHKEQQLLPTASQQYSSIVQNDHVTSNKQSDNHQRPYAKYSNGPVRFADVDNSHRNIHHESISVQQPFINQKQYFNLNPAIRHHGQDQRNILPVILDKTLFRDVLDRGHQQNKEHSSESPLPIKVTGVVRHHDGGPPRHYYDNNPAQETKSISHSFATSDGNVQRPFQNFLMAQYPQQVTLRTVRGYDVQPAVNMQFMDNYKHNSPQSPSGSYDQKQTTHAGRSKPQIDYQQQTSLNDDQFKRKFIYQRPPLDYTLIKLTPMRFQLANDQKNYNYVGSKNELDANSNQQLIASQNDAKSTENDPHRQSVRHIASPPSDLQSRRYQYDSLDYTPLSKGQKELEQYKPGSILAMLLPEFLKLGLGLTKSITPITEPTKYDHYGYSYNRPRKGFHIKLGMNPFLETKVLF